MAEDDEDLFTTEYGGGVMVAEDEQQEEAAIIEDQPEPVEAIDPVDAQVMEAEARLHEAGYYRLLMDGQVFGPDPDPIARRVLKRLRDFARLELAASLGVGTPRSPAVEAGVGFTPQEVKLLKGFVRDLNEVQLGAIKSMGKRLLEVPGAAKAVLSPILHPVRPRPAPTVVPVAVQAPPAPRPAAPKPAPRPAAKPAPQPPAKPTRRAVKVVAGVKGTLQTPQAKLTTPTAPPTPSEETAFMQSQAKAETAVAATVRTTKHVKDLI
jgi:hypothetical protein